MIDDPVVERMGFKFEADGLPRIAGRIAGLLILSADPLALEDLSKQLLVSRTSANSNARLLERLGAVERVSHPGDRRDYYQIRHDFHLQFLQLRMDQIRDTRSILSVALQSGAASDPTVRDRLETFEGFFSDMLYAVSDARDRWTRIPSGSRSPWLAPPAHDQPKPTGAR